MAATSGASRPKTLNMVAPSSQERSCGARTTSRCGTLSTSDCASGR